ncbi:MAG: phosphoenolpyruvate carboxykinase (GTP), partial [Actinobacteria bacterium]|nr:phosphoenolpyruvate carboxykinase (GTP) [Actinomycetota bacterium]
SERMAVAEGTIGELRRDQFAMMPFVGYNMADHWAHWLRVGADLRKTGSVPRIFQVNWFRKGADGRFLWPGFGENSRVLEWMLERVDGQVAAKESAIGLLPHDGALNVDGLDLSQTDLDELFAIDPESWRAEADATEEFFATFDGRVPPAVTKQLAILRQKLA